MYIDRDAMIAHPSAFSAEDLVWAVRTRLVTVDELQQSGELSREMLNVLREAATETKVKGFLGYNPADDASYFEDKLLQTIVKPCRREAETRAEYEIRKEYGEGSLLDRYLPLALDCIRKKNVHFDLWEYGRPLMDLASRITERLSEEAVEIFKEYARMDSMLEESVSADYSMIIPDSAERACYPRPRRMKRDPAPVMTDDNDRETRTPSIGNPVIRAIRSFIGGGKQAYGALYAPCAVAPARKFRVQVHLCGRGQDSEVDRKAKAIDPAAQLMDINPLDLNLKKGTRVTASLYLEKESAYAGKRTATLKWTGKPVSTQFYVRADGFIGEDLTGEVTISVGGAPVGTLSFMTRISETTDLMPAVVQARAFRKVFISYSHEDIQTAAAMASAYRANGIPYFFDHHSLESGAVFDDEIMRNIEESDLFLLLWSENAVHSKYVEMEYLHALKYAYPQRDKDSATITIKPFFINPFADPPAPLKGIYNFSRDLLAV